MTNSLNFTATPSEKLKNNDEITVEFTYNEDFAKSAGLELQNSSYSVTAVATEGSHLRGNGRWGITNKLNYKFDSSYTSLSDVKLDDIYCLKEKDGCYKKVYVTMHGTVNTKETTYPITGLLELNDFIIAGDGSLKYKRDDIDYSFYADEDEAYDNVLKPQLKKYNIDKVTFE